MKIDDQTETETVIISREDRLDAALHRERVRRTEVEHARAVDAYRAFLQTIKDKYAREWDNLVFDPDKPDARRERTMERPRAEGDA